MIGRMRVQVWNAQNDSVSPTNTAKPRGTLRRQSVWQNEHISHFNYLTSHLFDLCCSHQDEGQADINATEQSIIDLDADIGVVESQVREREDEIQGLQTEKELQSSGEVKELIQEVDEMSKR